jgi:hypothetical protein
MGKKKKINATFRKPVEHSMVVSPGGSFRPICNKHQDTFNGRDGWRGVNCKRCLKLKP